MGFWVVNSILLLLQVSDSHSVNNPVWSDG